MSEGTSRKKETSMKNQLEEDKMEREKRERKRKTQLLLSRFREDKAKHLKDKEGTGGALRDSVKIEGHSVTDAGNRPDPQPPRSKKDATIENEKFRRENKAREKKAKKLLSRFKADKEKHIREAEDNAKDGSPVKLLPNMKSLKKFFH